MEAVLTGTAEDLVLMLTEEENLGVLLRSGRVRHLAPSEDDVPQDAPVILSRLVRLLSTRRNGSKVAR